MAFLSVGRPDWEVELGRVGGEVCAELAAAGLVGPFVRAAVGDPMLLVTATGWRGGRVDAAWTVARVCARLWPGWLDGHGVGLRVWLPGWSATVGAAVMVGVAEGRVSRARWLLAAEIVEGS